MSFLFLCLTEVTVGCLQEYGGDYLVAYGQLISSYTGEEYNTPSPASIHLLQ